MMNPFLSGQPGGRLIRVDASGFKHEQIGERSPEPGRDVALTLDARIQALAEKALEGREGAVVALDPANGDVLAMASSPAFDPNDFGPGLTAAQWERLARDRSQPLVNRAIAEVYPPGSTFKVVVCFAGLCSDRASAGTSFDCPGYFQLGGTRFQCWRKSGHGTLDMRTAIEQSCNAYFCQLGLRTGPDKLRAMADAAGFGRKTGIELPGEVPGILPGAAWKMRVHRDAWRPGDTCNISIGQGYLAVTPLQMAVLVSAVANGGYVYRPRLMKASDDAKGELLSTVPWTAGALGLVRQGMHDVIQSDTGTGKRARVDGVEMGGKTGTAEYGPRGERRTHAWMLAFAPFERPRVALAIVIEDGLSGGMTAAPRVRQIVGGIFGVDVPAFVEETGDNG
jgi:penicillin-binding protein 2